MKIDIFDKRTISFVLIFTIIFMLLVDLSCVATTAGDSDVSISSIPAPDKFPVVRSSVEAVLIKSDQNVIKLNNFSDSQGNFMEISIDYLKENFTITLNNNVTKTVNVLTDDYKVVELYNSRLIVKYSDSEVTILPEESVIISSGSITDLKYNVSIIDIPGTEVIIGVKRSIEKIPLDAMAANVSRSQSVRSLNKYEVSCLFSELANSELFENILCYSIDWGDGTPVETYLPSQKEVTHLYKNSGIYLQALYVTDISGDIYKFENYYTVKYEGHLLHTYFVFDEYKEPIATTSAGVGVVALLGFALTETGKYKLLSLLPLLIPMYTHIRKDDVLDHFVRGEIYGLVKSDPGICYNEIMKKLDVKNGTLSYHLHKLEKMEMIKSRREGLKYRAFYSKDLKFPKEERFRLTEIQINILNIIKENDGITQREIAKKLNMKPQTINYNIKVLRQSELIRLRRMGRKTACYSL